MGPGCRIAVLFALLVALVTGAGAAAAHPLGSPASGSAASREKQMTSVVHAWSTRLNANDNAGIAKLFALPAIVIQGPYMYRLKTRDQVALWHSGLPCSGKIVSVTIKGRYATVVFLLGNRGKTKCDAPGTQAAARFEIVGGKIRSWEQVEVPEKQQAPGPVA